MPLERRRDARHLALRLLDRDAVAQARDHLEAGMVRAIALHRRQQLRAQRRPDVDVLEDRTRRQHADDRHRGLPDGAALPTIDGSPPKRRCHKRSEMTATAGASGSSSASV